MRYGEPIRVPFPPVRMMTSSCGSML
jgi:hypothetical protein